MAIQGLSRCAQRSDLTSDAFTNKNLIDVAGNAFNGGVLMALIVGTVASVDFDLIIATPAPVPDTLPADDDDDDSSSSSTGSSSSGSEGTAAVVGSHSGTADVTK